MKRLLPILVSALLLGMSTTPANAINRDQMISIAETYANHTWTSTWSNYTASCSGAYTSNFLDIYGVGNHTGMAYDWGGFDTISGFDSKIDQGHGAGSHSNDGVLSCTTGVDCSGFVSRCWDLPSKKGTSTISSVSHQISPNEVLKGDAYNKANAHIRLWHYQAADGQPVIYESAGGSKRKAWHNTGITWSSFAGYVPIRYDGVTEGNGPVPGALTNPFVVDTYPHHHDYTTNVAGPSNFDVYSCAPTTGEYGPEIVYKLLLPGEGLLTASVTDGAGVDIDLHILTHKDPDTCLARDDKVVGPLALQSKKVWLIADTWSNSSGTTYPGAYSLDISFQVTAPFEAPDPGPQCGDGACNGDEACSTCATDCGECSTSCLNRCEELAEFGELCYCDPSCEQAGDCCSDYPELCGEPEEVMEPPPVVESPEEAPEPATLPVLSTAVPVQWSDLSSRSTPGPRSAGGSWNPDDSKPMDFSAEESGCQTHSAPPGFLLLSLFLMGILRAGRQRRATP